MSKFNIQTTQNVEIELPLASVGARMLGSFLDMVILIIYVIVVNILLDHIFGIQVFQQSIGRMWIGLVVIFLPLTFYSLVLEYLWNGQTLGKKICNTRVVMANGDRLSVPQVALRWMFKPLDMWFPFSLPLVGIITMAATRKTQRLGDLVANTTVIKLKRQVSLEDTVYRVVKDDYNPVFKNVLILSDKDIRIIKNTLENYEKTKDMEKIKILGEKAKEILSIDKKTKNLPMLRTIIKDYNYLAVKENNK